MKSFLIAIVFVLMAQGFASAEKLHLTTGEVVEGEIIDQDDVSVTIQTGNIPSKYYRAQITSIESNQDAAIGDVIAKFKPEDFSEMSESKARLILKFMEVSGMRKNIEDRIAETISQAPPEREKEFKFLFNAQEVLKALVPIYDKHYTESELQELIRFFESSVGKKTLQVTPQIMQDVVQTIVGYFKNKTAMPDI
jgi:hypothetical protein